MKFKVSFNKPSSPSKDTSLTREEIGIEEVSIIAENRVSYVEDEVCKYTRISFSTIAFVSFFQYDHKKKVKDRKILYLKFVLSVFAMTFFVRMLLMTMTFRVHWFATPFNGTHNYNKIPVSIQNILYTFFCVLLVYCYINDFSRYLKFI